MPSASHDSAAELIGVTGPSLGAALLLCEHASAHVPDRYDGLGLSSSAALSHAAWDPGARDLSLYLAGRLDAPLVAGTVSRLVYDCNRPPASASAMPEKSELIDIPGNSGLTAEARAERVRTVYEPFCAMVQDQIKARIASARPTALITVHSFTPVYYGKPRAVEIGILHDTDSAMADAMLAAAPKLPHRRIERNAPYGAADGVTHSLQIHGIAHGLPNVMLEVRNDLLQTPEDIALIGDELTRLIKPALIHLGLLTQGSAHA